jgi:predicted dehydrogenase
MPVRIAVIEVSHWHSLNDAGYLTHLPKISDVALVALQDPDPASVAAVAAKLDPRLGAPKPFTDYRDMLSETKPDFVIALGRHAAMAQTAHHLLDTGFPFLMEKPMGVDAGEVQGIAEKAEKVRGFAAVPFFQRYLPFVTQARAGIANGLFGPLSSMSVRNMRQSSNRYVRWGAPWMLDPAVAGGGCLRNIGLHGLDMFLHLVGEEADVVSAQLSSRALGQRVEDYACVQLRSKSGVYCTIEVGNTFPYDGSPSAEPSYLVGDSEMALCGRDAMLMATKDGALRLVTANRQQSSSARPNEPPPLSILRDTLERWKSGRPPVTDVRDCWRAMRLADEAYRLADRSDSRAH